MSSSAAASALSARISPLDVPSTSRSPALHPAMETAGGATTPGGATSTTATKDEDDRESPPPAKRLRVTFTEEDCLVCAKPFAELIDTPKVVFGSCQHAVCMPCVQKHQSLGNTETACGCKEPYKFELSQPADTAPEPLLIKLTVTYRNDSRFVGYGMKKVSVLLQVGRVSQTTTLLGTLVRAESAKLEAVSHTNFVGLPGRFGMANAPLIVPFDGKRVGFAVNLLLSHLMPKCKEDGDCNEYGEGDSCEDCQALRNQSSDAIQCVASFKRDGQLDLVFPDYQGDRAGDIEVVAMAAPTVACSIAVPSIVVPAAPASATAAAPVAAATTAAAAAPAGGPAAAAPAGVARPSPHPPAV